MQNWKEPETSTIHLANGEQVSAVVNGISPEDGSGYVLVQGRNVKVMPLHTPWSFDWAEVLSIERNDGSTFEAVLSPLQLSEKTAIVDQGDEEVHLLQDDDAGGTWREMTDEEYEKERRAWSEDMKDMAQIEREWRDYRNEGLGERG